MSAVVALSQDVGVVAACKAMRVSRATLHRSQRAVKEKNTVTAAHPRALSSAERSAVLAVLCSAAHVDEAPAAAYATLLEGGRYLCSVSTMYRILRANKAVRERRDQRRLPVYTKPELMAERPNQVWSWDITKLKGPGVWDYYHLYVMLDIFSRCVVGWMVAERESGALARELIAACCRRQAVTSPGLTIHSDRGPAMMSKPVIGLLTALDVHKTVSRPHVSNDNPFSEAQFKTMKYRPSFPRIFGSIQDARQTLTPFFDWYNRDHRHSALAYMTPDSVHTGRAVILQEERRVVLQTAHAAHPERFVRGIPRPPELPAAAWINPPRVAETSDPLLSLGREEVPTQKLSK